MKFLRNDPALKKRRQELRRNQTDAEKAFWLHVRNRQFLGMKFFRQYSIGTFILDFYCPELKLAVELDGGQHTESDSKKYDVDRSEYLKTNGIYVMRFWNNDVLIHIDSVLNKIAKRINTSPEPL